MVDGGYLIFYI